MSKNRELIGVILIGAVISFLVVVFSIKAYASLSIYLEYHVQHVE